MTRYEIILPESGYRLTTVAETIQQAKAVEQLGWPYRRVGHSEGGHSRPGHAADKWVTPVERLPFPSPC